MLVKIASGEIYRVETFTWGWPEEELSVLSVLAVVGSPPFSTHSSSDSFSNNDNNKSYQKTSNNK